MTCTKPKPNRKIRAALSKEIERLFCVRKNWKYLVDTEGILPV